MKNREEILQKVREVFSSLFDGGIISNKVDVNERTVLLGNNSVFDSIGFVTFFMELEERVSDYKGEEVYLLVDEIHNFNPEDTVLTVGVLVDYIENLL